MKSEPKRVSAAATPLCSYVREWDGLLVEFFTLKRWYRSHDRTIDGTPYWVPVAAVSRTVLWTGPRHPTLEAAEGEARAKMAELTGGAV